MRFLKPATLAYLALTAILILLVIVQIFLPTMFETLGMKIFMGLILGVFALCVLLGFAGEKFTRKKVGFWVLHIGLVVFLLGAFLYAAFGYKTMVSLTVDGSYQDYIYVDGKRQSVDFEYKLTDFTAEYYDPVYDVYRVTENSSRQVMSDVEVVGGKCDFGKYGGIVTIDTSKETILLNVVGADSSVQYQAKKRITPSYYGGTLSFRRNGIVETKQIEINKTVRMGKYKIYLMAYQGNTATFLFKVDYGEFFSVIGCVMIILGSFYMCIVSDFIINAEKKRALQNISKLQSHKRASYKGGRK